MVRCEAVLFDMDGTLVDSSDSVERVWRDWAALRGIEPEALMKVAHGRTNPEIVRMVAPHLDLEKEEAFLRQADESCLDGIVAVPGAHELVKTLPAERWAIVTSAWRKLAEIRLGLVGLPMPAVLIAEDDVRRGKPHPEGYLQAAQRLGVPPSACLVIEDSHAGIEAGRAAGMTVVGIATTFTRAQLRHYCCIDDLRGVSVVA